MRILAAGLVAGVLDLADALIFFGLRGASPIVILQAIASGAFGQDAFRGGLPMAFAGVVFHFVIALAAAFVYFELRRRSAWLRANFLLGGILFGIALYVVMNFVIVPLSYARPQVHGFSVVANGLLAHMFLVGLPIAWILNVSRSESR